MTVGGEILSGHKEYFENKTHQVLGAEDDSAVSWWLGLDFRSYSILVTICNKDWSKRLKMSYQGTFPKNLNITKIE